MALTNTSLVYSTDQWFLGRQNGIDNFFRSPPSLYTILQIPFGTKITKEAIRDVNRGFGFTYARIAREC